MLWIVSIVLFLVGLGFLRAFFQGRDENYDNGTANVANAMLRASFGGQDPVDAGIRAAMSSKPSSDSVRPAPLWPLWVGLLATLAGIVLFIVAIVRALMD